MHGPLLLPQFVLVISLFPCVSVSDRRYQFIEFTCYQSGLEIYSNGVASMLKKLCISKGDYWISSDSIQLHPFSK